ncbi:MAG: tRNA (N(6)-L-threonylcarbamoyladenosine(37)-C(2))-methylthiotransferase MtaB, partial [Anaerolineae bacterium]|nr:tRNA (N(6)-L-threonylcarbamoyladenosine(37)-C(2))-methylthiotransferase MtaB [Anaerolineae bacterium]
VESKAEFSETLAFVEQMQFAGGHVFTYSARPGTAAAAMPGQVHNATRKARSAELRTLLAASAESYRAAFVGRELPVLWESISPNGDGAWQITGLTDNYLKISASAPQPIWNQIIPTRLTSITTHGLAGELLALPDIIPLSS